MSRSTQIEFERLVSAYHQQQLNDLMLAAPTFEEAGFITTATMVGSGGQVKMRCGPAEYHAEIFIHTSEDGKRWTLADLMGIETVRDWMLQNRPNTSDKPKLEIEVEYAFRLLSHGLRGDGRFNWLCRS
jgi:hypothetical protein